ncbi:toxin C-terminal domain-containing protein, partial [Candidatus Dependentiae bacterium]|nr:toxin C-terminal domain-containing protein [Candidatus Dependentiae bacterium]
AGIAYKGLLYGTKALYHGAQYGANFAYQNVAQGATFIGQNALPIGLAVGGGYLAYRLVKGGINMVRSETPIIIAVTDGKKIEFVAIPRRALIANNSYTTKFSGLIDPKLTVLATPLDVESIPDNIHLRDHGSIKKEKARALALKASSASSPNPQKPDNDKDKERYKRPNVRYTPEQIRKIAQERGWEEIKNHDADTSNQKLWYCPKENRYYSYDRTAHGGGVWKEFIKDGKSFKRIATIDSTLKKIRN